MGVPTEAKIARQREEPGEESAGDAREHMKTPEKAPRERSRAL